jgi:hypothetical protein
MRRLLPSHLVIVALALACAGSAQAAATRTDYVNQAEPICSAANKVIHRLNKRFVQLHSQARYGAAGAALGKTGAVLARSVDQVRQIPPPPGDEMTISNWLSLVDEIAADNRTMGRAEAHGDFAAVVRLERRNNRIGRRAHRLVKDWGFYSCVGNG